jgi:uncharacterized protein (DUF2249 family)
MSQITHAMQVDTRALEARNRRDLVFSKFDQLSVDMTMELVNDQDPSLCAASLSLRSPTYFPGPTWKAARMFGVLPLPNSREDMV